MPITKTHIDEFKHYLSESAICMEQLIQQLDDEQQALVGKEPHTIEAFAKQKQTTIEQLIKLDNLRQRTLHAVGIAEDNQAIKKFIAQTPSTEQAVLTALWTTLRDRSQQGQMKNIQSGILINICQYYTQTMLTILTGENSEDSKSYDKQGQIQKRKGAGGKHTIA